MATANPTAPLAPVNTLLDACVAGQSGADNPHIWSSAFWMAHEAGRALSAVSAVKKCRMSRGYSVRVETAATLFIVKFGGDKLNQVTVNRP